MQELNICLCVVVGKSNYRMNILGPVMPTRGMGYRFLVGEVEEFCIKVKFVYCDVVKEKDDPEGRSDLIWAEADLPKEFSVFQLERAGFDEYPH